MDISELTQKGTLFVEITDEMRIEILQRVKELENGIKTNGIYAEIDTVKISVFELISLKEELMVSLVTEKIAWDLLPVKLTRVSKKWLKLQCMINKQLEYK